MMVLVSSSSGSDGRLEEDFREVRGQLSVPALVETWTLCCGFRRISWSLVAFLVLVLVLLAFWVWLSVQEELLVDQRDQEVLTSYGDGAFRVSLSELLLLLQRSEVTPQRSQLLLEPSGRSRCWLMEVLMEVLFVPPPSAPPAAGFHDTQRQPIRGQTQNPSCHRLQRPLATFGFNTTIPMRLCSPSRPDIVLLIPEKWWRVSTPGSESHSLLFYNNFNNKKIRQTWPVKLKAWL